jgi:ABC-type microcin C transport system permease subunit YejE
VIRLSPLNQRRWRNFRANRRATWALVDVLTSFRSAFGLVDLTFA